MQKSLFENVGVSQLTEEAHNATIYSIFKYIIGEGRLWGFGPGLAGPAGRGPFHFSKLPYIVALRARPLSRTGSTTFRPNLCTPLFYIVAKRAPSLRLRGSTTFRPILCTYPSKSPPSLHVFRLHLTHLTIRSTTCPAL